MSIPQPRPVHRDEKSAHEIWRDNRYARRLIDRFAAAHTCIFLQSVVDTYRLFYNPIAVAIFADDLLTDPP